MDTKNGGKDIDTYEIDRGDKPEKSISKANYFKETLKNIQIGSMVILDHKKFYCTGWGQRCTLAHYAYQLKRKGEGEWEIRHTNPGLAEVTRIK